MKKRMLLSIIYCFIFYNSFAWSDSTVKTTDLKNLVGCWKGSITYLDYTSNKPFTMPSDLIVKDFTKTKLIVCSVLYPKEPGANSLDTIFISGDGRFLNNEIIKSKKSYGKDSLEIITEVVGIDGNDHKPAILRHVYTLGKNTYSVRKEVQFIGQVKWILRNEYKFTRVKPCN